MGSLSELHRKHILTGFLDLHRQISEIEGLLAQSLVDSPFSAYFNDLSPVERNVLAGYFSRVRSTMLACLEEAEIPLDVRKTGIRWAVQTRTVFLGIALEEMSADRLRGYGELTPEGRERVTKITRDLERLVDRIGTYLREGIGESLADRLARLDATPASRQILTLLDAIASRWQLVEFRPALDNMVARLESPQFEIAIFGRVSSGKSSLLNHVAGTDALPVGVNPTTAVPTRLMLGLVATATISFAELPAQHVPVNELRSFASEEGNPGNRKHVTEIRVRLPSARLEEGVVLVDTPGIGSLAHGGSAETLAYLPRCDLGILLVDAASTLTQDDLDILRLLYRAGIPAQVLLSKADLLNPADRAKASAYVHQQIFDGLGLELSVHPVSTVGADEALLTAWFEQHVRPLFQQHRDLAEASLQRKMAALRQSMAAALATILARQQGSIHPGDANRQLSQARQLLDQGDAAEAQARLRARDWLGAPTALVERIVHEAAETISGEASAAADTVLARTIESAVVQRIASARSVVTELRQQLVDILQHLSGEAQIGNVDPASVRNYAIRGLPAIELSDLSSRFHYSRPAWSTFVPAIGERLVERTLREQFASAIRDFVEPYDRQLHAWLKATVSQLGELYEAQAEAAREQLRRLSANTTGEPADVSQLKADLSALRHSS